MVERTPDAAVVVRMWAGRHDSIVRARLIDVASGTSEVAVGIRDIAAAFDAYLRAFERQATTSRQELRDADATESRRHG